MHCLLSIIIKMCLANLIVITPIPSSTALYQRRMEEHHNITYSHDQLTYLSKSQLCYNLTGLPPGSIKRIRELKVNKKRVRIKQQKTSTINHANLRNLKQINTTNEVRQQQTKEFPYATINARSIKPKEVIILKALNEIPNWPVSYYRNLAQRTLRMISNGY